MRLAAAFLTALLVFACVEAPAPPLTEPATTPTATVEPTATPRATPTPAPGFGLTEGALVEHINRSIGAEERKLRLESETTLGDGTPRHTYTNTIDTMDIIGEGYPHRIEIVADWPLHITRPPLTFLMIATATAVFPAQTAEFVQWYNTSQGHSGMTFRDGRRAERFIDPRGGVIILSFLAPNSGS
jgi:hypothetical protein